MSIIIKSLDSLPEHCYDCPCHDGESGYCKADKGHRYSEYRPFWCPLQQISNTYYGRLIRFNDIQTTTAPIAPIFKGDKVHYEGIAFLKQILEIPPVEAIPISAIEEMKSRISELNEFSKDEIDELYMQDVIKIINECCGIIEADKTESEDKDICEKCLYAEETDGSHCYECVKGKSKFKEKVKSRNVYSV